MGGGPGFWQDVYLGGDELAVAEATSRTPGIYRTRQAPEISSYDPGILEWGTTYHWRIDGVDKAGPQSPWKGAVWSFTTGIGLAVVDDSESYTEDEGGRIYEAWIGGWTNDTGSTVGNVLAPFAEQTVVRGGRQSMPMDYDNGKQPWYSESQRTWATSQDWAMKGADTLTLYFRGEASKGRDPLYAGIEDSAGQVAVVVHPDAEAVRATEWLTWHIRLAEVRAAGVNVTAVRKMVIGVGNRENPESGGTGRLYIDDIRLTKR